MVVISKDSTGKCGPSAPKNTAAKASGKVT